MKRLLVLAACVIAAIACEELLLGGAATHDVSMALLAGGGALSLPTIALASAAMLVRLFVRFLLPGLVVQAIVLGLVDRRAQSRAVRTPSE